VFVLLGECGDPEEIFFGETFYNTHKIFENDFPVHSELRAKRLTNLS
jgi:hypothetical protein